MPKPAAEPASVPSKVRLNFCSYNTVHFIKWVSYVFRDLQHIPKGPVSPLTDVKGRTMFRITITSTTVHRNRSLATKIGVFCPRLLALYPATKGTWWMKRKTLDDRVPISPNTCQCNVDHPPCTWWATTCQPTTTDTTTWDRGLL